MDKIKTKLSIKTFETDQEILDEMYQQYLNCLPAVRYIKSLSIPDEVIKDNIVKIFDFVCDTNYCKKCPGLNNCAKQNPRLITKIVYTHGIVDRELVPCKKLSEKVEYMSQFKINDIDQALISNEDSDEDILTKKKLLVKGIVKEKNYNWYYFCGQNRRKMTKIVYGMLQSFIENHEGPIAYLNAPSRIKELADFSYQKNKIEFNKRIELYCNVPILVLDDLGNEFVSDYVRDTIIFPIISTRASKRLCTIIISNYELKELLTLYSTSGSGTNMLRAEQIVKQINLLSEGAIKIA